MRAGPAPARPSRCPEPPGLAPPVPPGKALWGGEPEPEPAGSAGLRVPRAFPVRLTGPQGTHTDVRLPPGELSPRQPRQARAGTRGDPTLRSDSHAGFSTAARVQDAVTQTPERPFCSARRPGHTTATPTLRGASSGHVGAPKAAEGGRGCPQEARAPGEHSRTGPCLRFRRAGRAAAALVVIGTGIWGESPCCPQGPSFGAPSSLPGLVSTCSVHLSPA